MRSTCCGRDPAALALPGPNVGHAGARTTWRDTRGTLPLIYIHSTSALHYAIKAVTQPATRSTLGHIFWEMEAKWDP